MKLKAITRRIVLLIAVTAMFTQTAATETDATNYFTNRPFGWGTCSDASGSAYTLDGGARAEEPKTIVLYASGSDDRNAIQKAITDNDIIIFDG